MWSEVPQSGLEHTALGIPHAFLNNRKNFSSLVSFMTPVLYDWLCFCCNAMDSIHLTFICRKSRISEVLLMVYGDCWIEDLTQRQMSLPTRVSSHGGCSQSPRASPPSPPSQIISDILQNSIRPLTLSGTCSHSLGSHIRL